MSLEGFPPAGVPSFLTVPDRIVYDADLGDTGWENVPGFNGFGAQATFDVPVRDGDGSQGLRVTISRSAAQTVDSNGFEIDITNVDGDAVAAAIDTTARTVTGNVQDATTLAGFKTIVDAVANLSSEYFGGETGTSTAGTVTDGLSAGATEDRAGWVVICVNHDVLIKTGTSTPSNNDGARFRRGNGLWTFYLPASHWFYIRRQGTTDAAGSAELYLIDT